MRILIALTLLAASAFAQTDCNDNGAAECAKLVPPMVLVKGDGETYFWVPNDNKLHPPSAEGYYYLECSADTELQISLKTTTPDTNANSLYVSMDKSWYRATWHFTWEKTPTWHTFDKKTYKLKKGLHVLHIWNREDGTKIHEARLESDVCHFVEEPQPTEAPTESPTEATEEPTEATEEPTEATEEPTEATEEPTEATEEPTEATEEPTEATEEPTETTDEPTEELAPPPLPIVGPMSFSEPMQSSPIQSPPMETTADPSEATAEPTEATDEPTEATEEPTEATVEPTEATMEPTEATDEPTEATEEPTEATMEPTEATGEPTEATEEPTEATMEPTEATEEPTEATEEPTEATEEPTEATEEPTEATEEPTEATEEPSEATEEPTEATEEPTEATEEPTEATEEPTTAVPTTPDPTEATQEPSVSPTPLVWCPPSERYLNHKGTNLKTISGLESIEACEEACDNYEGSPACNFVWFFHPVGNRKSRCKMVGDAHKLKPWNPTDTRAITFAGRLCGVRDMTVPCKRAGHCWVTDTCDPVTETCQPGLYPDQLKDTLQDATFLVETDAFSTEDMFTLLQLLLAMIGLFVIAYASFTTAKAFLCSHSYTRVPAHISMVEEEL